MHNAQNTNEVIAQYRDALVAQLDARIVYEAKKACAKKNVQVEVTQENASTVLSEANTSMFKTTRDIRAAFSHVRIAELLLASSFDVAKLTHRERSNAATNVYTIKKIVNAMRALAKVASLDHYTRAVFLSTLALESNDMQLTHDDAKACCSLSVSTSKDRDALLVRYEAHVDIDTASTQSSSSINALQAINVLNETRNAANTTCYTVKRDSFASLALAELFNVKLVADVETVETPTVEVETKAKRKRSK
jgi:hypothetical protein